MAERLHSSTTRGVVLMSSSRNIKLPCEKSETGGRRLCRCVRGIHVTRLYDYCPDSLTLERAGPTCKKLFAAD